MIYYLLLSLLKGTTGFGTNPGGLFGQPNQQTTSLFSKPFGQATTTQTTGFSFGNTSTLGQPSTNTMVRKTDLELIADLNCVCVSQKKKTLQCNMTS